MKYLFAIVLPPLAFAMVRKPGQAVLSLILCCTVLGWLPAAVWACCVVGSTDADDRTNRMIAAMNPKPIGDAAKAYNPDTDWDKTAIYGVPPKPETPLASKLDYRIFKDIPEGG